MQADIGLFGLSDALITDLHRVFEGTPNVDEVVIFGSRVKGNFTQGSDIDLTIKGKAVSFSTILDLMSKIESLDLLYKIDVQNYGSITNSELLEHIDRVGKVFWKRTDELSIK